MGKHNAENERIRHRYMTYLQEAKRQSEASIDKAMAAISRFENHTGHRDFKKFHQQSAVGFKRHLMEQRAARTGERLSSATLHSTLTALRAFFIWLADQPRYRAKIQYSDADYFNASERDRAVATAKREQPVPTVEQIRHVINSMPVETEIERRDRALIAFTLLTGARDGAIASMKLKHVDLEKGLVMHDARDVRTKFSKTFTTWFFPVGDDVRGIVEDWVVYLRKEKLWGDADPLSPATNVEVGASRKFEAVGLARENWKTASPIREVFRAAFDAVGQPYFNPHSFRKTLAQLGERLCTNLAEMKAWSQNLGHENVSTTMNSYGSLSGAEQAKIIRKLGRPKIPDDDRIAKIMEILVK
jgi:integrase